MTASNELKTQIEAAFDYRGHATVHLKEGTAIVGFVYNRYLEGPGYIDLFVKDSDEKRRIPVAEIARVELTGKNHAEAYDEFLKRTGGKS